MSDEHAPYHCPNGHRVPFAEARECDECDARVTYVVLAGALADSQRSEFYRKELDFIAESWPESMAGQWARKVVESRT